MENTDRDTVMVTVRVRVGVRVGDMVGAGAREHPRWSYVYDDFGNLTALGDRVITIDPDTNRLAGEGMSAPVYDGLGNLLRLYRDGRARWNRRDAEGRVLEAWSEGVETHYRFAYDHEGERVATFTDAGLHTNRVLYTLRDGSGKVLTDLLWSKGGTWSRMADRVYLGRDEQVRVAYDENGVPTCVTSLRDHLGSLRAEVSGAGSWTRIDLWPYGEIRQETLHGLQGSTLEDGVHLFTGHERDWVGTADDARKGLDYMHARYYSFEMGRFLSMDPVGGTVGSSQSWNRYAYVRGNPVNAVDPDGEFLHILIGAAAGSVINAGIRVVANVSAGREWSNGVARAAVVGAAAGAVTAGTAGLATGAAASMMGATAMSGTPVTAIVVGGAIGGAAGGAVQGAGNKAIVEGSKNKKAILNAAKHGAVVGAATGALGSLWGSPSADTGKAGEIAQGAIDAVAAETSAIIDVAIEVFSTEPTVERDKGEDNKEMDIKRKITPAEDGQ